MISALELLLKIWAKPCLQLIKTYAPFPRIEPAAEKSVATLVKDKGYGGACMHSEAFYLFISPIYMNIHLDNDSGW